MPSRLYAETEREEQWCGVWAHGLVVQVLSPHAELQLEHTLEHTRAAALPGTTGTVLVQGVAAHLKKSAGLLLAVGLIAACLAGSRLFVTLEGCFGIIFRLRGRDPLRQNRMAFGMLALYLVIVPVVFLISILPTGLVALVDPRGQSPLGVVLSGGARLLVWFAAAVLFFGATYAFVPNRRGHWRTWRRPSRRRALRSPNVCRRPAPSLSYTSMSCQ